MGAEDALFSSARGQREPLKRDKGIAWTFSSPRCCTLLGLATFKKSTQRTEGVCAVHDVLEILTRNCILAMVASVMLRDRGIVCLEGPFSGVHTFPMVFRETGSGLSGPRISTEETPKIQ